MKRVFILLSLVVMSSFCFGQTTSAKEKADSIANVESQKVVQEIVSTAPIKELQEWLFKNWTAEKYQEFVQLYNFFVNERYKEYLQKKIKQK